jgi:hypothetical protein
MKKFFIYLSAVSVSALNAQTLTQATHEPTIGNVTKIRQLDTSAFTSGLPLSGTGANQVWDFSNAHALNTETITNIYAAPSDYTQSASYPGATIVQDLPGNMYTFFKSVSSPTAQAEIVGIDRPSIKMTFTNSAIVIQYPAGLGFSVSDDVSGTYSVGTINGPVEGETQTVADGTGTLILGPGATFSNVIRLKSVQNLTLTQGSLTGTLKQTVYNFYDQAQKFAIINISYIEMAMAGGSPSVTAGMFANANNYATVGIDENNSLANSLQLFPNPASQLLFVNTGAAVKSVALFNMAGTKVPVQEKDGVINVSTLPNGIYFLKLESATGTVARKVVVAH